MKKRPTVIGVDVPESGAEPLVVYSLGALLVFRPVERMTCSSYVLFLERVGTELHPSSSSTCADASKSEKSPHETPEDSFSSDATTLITRARSAGLSSMLNFAGREIGIRCVISVKERARLDYLLIHFSRDRLGQ